MDWKAVVAGSFFWVCSGTAHAGDTIEYADGTLNPQEMTVEHWVAEADRPVFDPRLCLYGYPAAKMGNHPGARKIFERCANAGVQGAMPWMAWTEENGYDRPSDPVKAAEWDKRLAETGSSLGEFNYGLDLLRGHGAPQDLVVGAHTSIGPPRAGTPTRPISRSTATTPRPSRPTRTSRAIVCRAADVAPAISPRRYGQALCAATCHRLARARACTRGRRQFPGSIIVGRKTMHVFDDSHIKWNRVEGFDHVQYQVCEVDVENRTVDVLFKFDANSKIALHWHRAPYRTLVLQGELRIYRTNGELIEVRPTGSYVRGKASDEPHTEGGGDQDVIVFFSNRQVDDLVYQIIDESGATIATFGLAEFAGLQKMQEQGFVRGVSVPELASA